MTSRTAARLAWGIAILSYAIVAACLVLLWLNRATIRSVGAGPVGNLVPAATLGALGALIASRRPSNAIGWLMLFIAPLVGISALAALITIRALLAGVSPHGWVRWTAWVQYWIGSPPLGALILIFLLFPDGRLLSRRWRWVARLTVLGSAWFVAGAVLDAAPVELSPHLPKVGNPVGVPALAGFSNGPAFLVIVVLIVVAMASLFLRLRRSMGEQRQQLKWFAYAAGVSVGLLILAIPATSLSPALSNAMFTVAFSLGFAFLVPAAAALAILRYGLYEVDVVINKTILYFSLAAVITAIYAGIVVGIGAIIGSKGNVVLSVLATAIVAIAFQPIRDRSRRFANRLVYGKRATPYEVLSEFADRMARTYSVEDVLPRTARILGEATGAVRADVWLQVGAELQAAGSWPSAPPSERIPLTDAEVPGQAARRCSRPGRARPSQRAFDRGPACFPAAAGGRPGRGTAEARTQHPRWGTTAARSTGREDATGRLADRAERGESARGAGPGTDGGAGGPGKPAGARQGDLPSAPRRPGPGRRPAGSGPQGAAPRHRGGGGDLPLPGGRGGGGLLQRARGPAERGEVRGRVARRGSPVSGRSCPFVRGRR